MQVLFKFTAWALVVPPYCHSSLPSGNQARLGTGPKVSSFFREGSTLSGWLSSERLPGCCAFEHIVLSVSWGVSIHLCIPVLLQMRFLRSLSSLLPLSRSSEEPWSWAAWWSPPGWPPPGAWTGRSWTAQMTPWASSSPVGPSSSLPSTTRPWAVTSVWPGCLQGPWPACQPPWH